MTRTTRAPITAKIAVSVACLVCASLTPAAIAVGAEGVVHFQKESFKAYQQQLAGGQIHAATFNKKAHTLHLTLNDGRHMLVSYPSHEEPQLAAQLSAKGVPVTVEKKKKPAVKAVHHTLRYVAGGILVVVIAVVAAVLLIDRRRKLGEADAGQGSAGAQAPATGEPE
jgi:hypothetical protein